MSNVLLKNSFPRYHTYAHKLYTCSTNSQLPLCQSYYKIYGIPVSLLPGSISENIFTATGYLDYWNLSSILWNYMLCLSNKLYKKFHALIELKYFLWFFPFAAIPFCLPDIFPMFPPTDSVRCIKSNVLTCNI